MRILNLTVRNFRSLTSVDIPLHPLNVVIGPNGSGKTALIEVLLLLQRGSQGQLSKFFEDRGGYQAVLSQSYSRWSSNRLEVQVDFEGSVADGNGRHEYVLAIQSAGYGHEVAKEFFQNQNARGEIERFFTGANYYQPIDVASRSPVRLPQSLTPALLPGEQGESLYSALYNLRISNAGLYERLISVVAQAFPGFKRFEFPVVGAGQVTLTWYDRCCPQPLYPNQLSEGTLRFLWLLALVFTAPSGSLLLIDEPETSLHPELLRILALLLQEAALETQVIVATHSSDLISWLQPDEVLIADKEDGQTRFTWADTLDLQNWLAEYSLRDLWLMGHLGGRP